MATKSLDQLPSLKESNHHSDQSDPLRAEVLLVWGDPNMGTDKTDKTDKKSPPPGKKKQEEGDSLDVPPLYKSDGLLKNPQLQPGGNSSHAEDLLWGKGRRDSTPAPEKHRLANPADTTQLFSGERLAPNGNSKRIETVRIEPRYEPHEFAQAKEAARKSGKPLIAFLGEPSRCPPCQTLGSQTSPVLEKNFKGKAVFAHISSDAHPDLLDPNNSGIPQVRMFKVEKDGRMRLMSDFDKFDSQPEEQKGRSADQLSHWLKKKGVR